MEPAGCEELINKAAKVGYCRPATDKAYQPHLYRPNAYHSRAQYCPQPYTPHSKRGPTKLLTLHEALFGFGVEGFWLGVILGCMIPMPKIASSIRNSQNSSTVLTTGSADGPLLFAGTLTYPLCSMYKIVGAQRPSTTRIQ